MKKETTDTNWGKVAQAAHAADHQTRLAETQAQLEAERRAHAETVRTLERARTAGKKAVQVPRPSSPRAGKGDIVEVIFSDVHGNQVDPAAFSALLGDLKILRPDRIFIGGDFINCGGFLAEHHVLGYVSEADDSYEDDMAVANKLLDAIMESSSCPDIHYLEGNHEWRVERWALTQRLAHHKDVELLRKTFCAEHVLRLRERGIRYYRQGHLHEGCDTPGWVKLDKMFYVHKISNSKDAADVALAKAGGNICYFDTHRASFKPKHIPGIGLVSAWNPGCLCKRQPLYANTRPTEWTHGYLVRFISRATGNFSMFNVTINAGESYAGMLLKGNRTDA
jgi:hypothetical protein